MIIINKSKGTTLAKDAKLLTSLLDKSLGLLNRSNPRSLIFKTRFGIHTLFLNEKIDVLILDKENKVVKVFENVKPNTLLFWNPKYSTVIELTRGNIKNSNTKVGDKLAY